MAHELVERQRQQRRENEQGRELRSRLRREGFPSGRGMSPPQLPIATIQDYARWYLLFTGIDPQRLTPGQFQRLKKICLVTGHEDLHQQLTLPDLCEAVAADLADSVRDDDRRFYAEKEGISEVEADAALLKSQGFTFGQYAARRNREAAGLRMRALLLRRPSRTAAPALGRMARPRARGRLRRRGLRRTRGGCRSPGRPSDPEPALVRPSLPGGVQ